jgi:hypothetical protein
MEFIYPPRYLGAASWNALQNFPPSPAVQSLELWLRSRPMLDVAYLVVGALFLGVCVLYALACDHL